MSKMPNYPIAVGEVSSNLYPFELQVVVGNTPIAVIVVQAHDVQSAHEAAARALRIEPADRQIPYIHIDQIDLDQPRRAM
jgi:hypothetical protein